MLSALTNEALEHITGVYVNCAKGDELLAVKLAQVTIDQLNQAAQLVDLQASRGTCKSYVSEPCDSGSIYARACTVLGCRPHDVRLYDSTARREVSQTAAHSRT